MKVRDVLLGACCPAKLSPGNLPWCHAFSQGCWLQAAAVRFLGISREALGNLWWLSSNSDIANFKTGPCAPASAVCQLLIELRSPMDGGNLWWKRSPRACATQGPRLD